MAIFHLHVRQGSRVGGYSAAYCASYAVRHGEHASRDDLVFAEAGNLPAWANGDARLFWAGVDEFSRANGRLYTEFECALPRELTLERNIELIRGYIATIANRPDGLVPFEFGVHYKDGNPHFHCVFSTRVDDGIERDRKTWFRPAVNSPKSPTSGGARSWSEETDKSWMKSVRATWANHVNDELERAGSAERIDHRSHADRGLVDLPTRHEGIDGRQRLRVREYNNRAREINKLNAELAVVKSEILAAGFTRDEYREFRKLHPSDAKRLRDERRDRNEAQELGVRVAELEVARQIISSAIRAAAETLPGLIGLDVLPVRLPPDQLRPTFISKLMASGATLHKRMPAEKLAFVEREAAIRLLPGYDREVIREALQVGAVRFGRMKLTGPIDFQRAALAEARGLGILDRIQTRPELASEFSTTTAASATTARPTAMQTNQELPVKLDFIDIQPASPASAMATASLLSSPHDLAAEFAIRISSLEAAMNTDLVAAKAARDQLEWKEAMRELELELSKMSNGMLLDLKNLKVQDVEMSLVSLERLIVLMINCVSLGAVRIEAKLGVDLAARRQLALMAATELQDRKERPTTAAGKKHALSDYHAAVHARVGTLEHRRADSARQALAISSGSANAARELRLARQRAGFDRFQKSRGNETIGDREKALTKAKSVEEKLRVAMPEALTIWSFPSTRAAHGEAFAKLKVATKGRRQAQAALIEFEKQLEEAAQNEECKQSASDAKMAAAESNELHELRVEIARFKPQIISADAAIAREKKAMSRPVETLGETAATLAKEARAAQDAEAEQARRNSYCGPPMG